MEKIARAQALRAVRNFEAAVRSHEMRGNGDPEDIPIIDMNYKIARQNLCKLLGISGRVRMRER